LSLAARLETRSAHVAVLGLGYAGLPMAVELAQAGYSVTGIDIDEGRVAAVAGGTSPVSDVADEDLAQLTSEGRLSASSSFAALSEADCALICVPTPLTDERRPDMRFVEAAARSIAEHVHPGMLVVLQSTCALGATREILLAAIEEASSLTVGTHFFVAFAPERIDPGNARFNVRNTPKLVSGITPACSELAARLFAPIVEQVISVSSPEVAEMAKLLENTFRFINISLANEVALLCDRVGISAWEVIDAAATKPFAFMPHYPGAGVGGHCIPIVPFFFQAAAQDHGTGAGLIEAAGQVNDEMPRFVVQKLERLLAERGKLLSACRVLVLGMAYKADISDCRESPSLTVHALLQEQARLVAYYDPYVPSIGSATSLTAAELAEQRFDAAVLLTGHSGVDYALVGRQADFILDGRNCLPTLPGATVVTL
jgi:UDP-N-acetyl-D-glucosamine dehydrogenase